MNLKIFLLTGVLFKLLSYRNNIILDRKEIKVEYTNLKKTPVSKNEFKNLFTSKFPLHSTLFLNIHRISYKFGGTKMLIDIFIYNNKNSYIKIESRNKLLKNKEILILDIKKRRTLKQKKNQLKSKFGTKKFQG
mmetsp:Transcript_16320/g.19557  ORF Transcript_16320/g.19557 Transcript_16320/m.19557 type:complete len:134 (-) Transcript_16320:814-1215(-)